MAFVEITVVAWAQIGRGTAERHQPSHAAAVFARSSA
jgi:hypothetical protein